MTARKSRYGSRRSSSSRRSSRTTLSMKNGPPVKPIPEQPYRKVNLAVKLTGSEFASLSVPEDTQIKTEAFTINCAAYTSTGKEEYSNPRDELHSDRLIGEVETAEEERWDLEYTSEIQPGDVFSFQGRPGTYVFLGIHTLSDEFIIFEPHDTEAKNWNSDYENKYYTQHKGDFIDIQGGYPRL